MNRNQQGYTLIELMISMLLGLMLISGFGSLFVQSQKNSTVQRSLSYMMEDGRYVLEVFGGELRRADFLRNKKEAGGDAKTVFTADPADPADTNVLGSTMSFSAGDYIRGEYNAAGFGSAADRPYNINRLALRYQLNNNAELTNLGSTNSACGKDILLTAGEDPATQVHVVTLYFYVAFDAVTNAPVLYCVANRRNFSDRSKDKTSPAEQPLISNVQKLVITYGIDTDADSAANYYVEADRMVITDATLTNAKITSMVPVTGGAITGGTLASPAVNLSGTYSNGTATGIISAGIGGIISAGTCNAPVTNGTTTTCATLTGATVSYWQTVVATKLSVVLRSEDDNLTQNVVSYTIDGDPNSPYTATDKRLYRVSSSTIAFRNKIL